MRHGISGDMKCSNQYAADNAESSGPGNIVNRGVSQASAPVSREQDDGQLQKDKRQNAVTKRVFCEDELLNLERLDHSRDWLQRDFVTDNADDKFGKREVEPQLHRKEERCCEDDRIATDCNRQSRHDRNPNI